MPNRIMRNESQVFWNYSLDLYARQGVAEACLELQDAYRLDVNLLLFCFWHSEAYGEIDQELMAAVVKLSQLWRAQVVEPLRNTRSWMKLHANPDERFNSLRERIKEDELLAEKYQQEQIETLASECNANRLCAFASGDIETNIGRLLHEVEIELDEGITSRVRIIRSALGK